MEQYDTEKQKLQNIHERLIRIHNCLMNILTVLIGIALLIAYKIFSN